MEERRRFVRLNVRLDVDCTVLPSGVVQRAVSKDIGGGGFRLWTEKPFEPGTSLQLAITLSGRDAPVNVAAEVVWSEQSKTTGRIDRRQSVEVGTRCVEISPNDHVALTAFVSAGLRPATNLGL